MHRDPMPRKDKIRYLVTLPGAQDALPRHFWKPSAALRAQGWALKRIPDHWPDFTDPTDAPALYAAAAGAAIALNQELDRTRDGRAMAAAPAPPPAPIKRTVGNLIDAYRRDDAFTTLADKTQAEYAKCLSKVRAWAVDGAGPNGGTPGGALIAAIDSQRVKTFARSMADTPSMANATIRVLRLLLNWGMDANHKHPNGGRWCNANPAANPDLEAAAVSGRIWPRRAIELFVAKADARGEVGIGTAVVLDEWLGQREADILRIPRTVLRAGSLIFRQAKGTNERRGKVGAGVVLPVGKVPVLRDRIDLQLAWNDAFYAKRAVDNAGSKMLRETAEVVPLQIILGEDGQPYKADWFRHRFQAIRDAVEADMLTAAGWRQVDGTRTNKMGDTVDCLVWRNDAVEKALHNHPAKERAAERERRRRRDASFEIDYLLPGRDAEDADAFRLYIGELQFMHLRHTAITRLAEAGVPAEKIAAISGHSLRTVQLILERYLIRTAEMAGSAFEMRLMKEAEGS
jgi:hypothetical protein